MSARERKTVVGKLIRHRRGFGFVVPHDPSLGEDIYVPARAMGGAVHGDEVRVRIDRRIERGRGTGSARRRRFKGEVVEIRQRSHEPIIGTLYYDGTMPFVAPLDDRFPDRIRVRIAEAEGVLAGQIVAVSIAGRAGRNEPLVGHLIDVLGSADDPEIQYRIVCLRHDIPWEFPADVSREVTLAAEPSDGDCQGRLDFRSWLTFTIDGEEARDFDDAVSLQKKPDGSYRLGVHIADVGHYVALHSRADQEALRRGTSVYFPDRAIPMLPERLSSELCSLLPGRDRLTVSVVMEIDRKGRVEKASFGPSVICSRHRLTYSFVQELLERPASGCNNQELVSVLKQMLELSQILQQTRYSRGAIDFDLPEAEVVYSLDGEVFDIVQAERNQAHRIIEEFMLVANETVAQYLQEREVPLIFRIHEDPDPAKVEQFQETALRFGYRLSRESKSRPTPQDFQRLIEKLSGKKEEKFLTYLMLRTLAQARYADKNSGHFGLASATYTHFTSPIRRYPDLVVHRILKGALSEEAFDEGIDLEEIAQLSSQRERQAVEAEREIMRWLMACFLADKIGEEFTGFIVGIQDSGFFVELADHFVEGYVAAAVIPDDYYRFDERTHSLVGENSRRVFRIGDTIRVRVDKVRLDRHLIDFSVAD